MINEIKNTLRPITGKIIDINDINISDISLILNKLCKDEILKLQDDVISIQHTPIGDIEINIGDNFYIIDFKTQDMDKVYSVPNLISIKKAKDILINHDNYIIYVFIEYKINNNILLISNIKIQNIESLDWSYLAIQNLGRGQLQIKNTSTDLIFNNDVTRSEWLNQFKDKALEYYNNLILKIVEYKTEWEEE